jgi:hypothetical protein
MKTSYILVGVAAVVVLYLVMSKSTTLVKGGTTGTGGSSWLTGLGAAATGVSNLWDSASASSSTTTGTDTTTGAE